MAYWPYRIFGGYKMMLQIFISAAFDNTFYHYLLIKNLKYVENGNPKDCNEILLFSYFFYTKHISNTEYYMIS